MDANSIIENHVISGEKKQRVIAVAGATASGKSALAVEIAKSYNGEIISFDSMQIYKGMNIGTAKPDADEMDGIPHHLFDFADPREPFSCGEYAEMAKSVIAGVAARGKIPVLCGGTGLYLDSVISVSSLPEPPRDNKLRTELEEIAKSAGNGYLYDMLKSFDPESAEKIHPNNVRRVIRAIEIYKLTGITKTQWDKKSVEAETPYDSIVIGLHFKDREKLYDRINRRVDLMIQKGLADEARSLYNSGALNPGGGGIQAIGYKELIPYLNGEISLDAAADEIKKATRHYAKRQITWFSRKNYINWIIID